MPDAGIFGFGGAVGGGGGDVIIGFGGGVGWFSLFDGRDVDISK